MALSIIQTGSSLQLMDEAGGLTALTLPAGVTLQTNVPPRWCIYNRNVILVNTPSQPLAITSDGIVRILSPKPPRLAPILAGVSGGTLSGSFRVKETFVTLDSFGNILSESGYGPESTKVAIASKFLGVSNADISPDAITLRRFYRTTDNGAVFFQWVDLDGNVLTTIQDDLSDAGLSIFSAPVLGTPPRLTLIAEFRGRLFGVGDIDIDNVRYTEAGVQYAWPADNLIPIVGQGSDEFGIIGMAPRREALLVGRRNVLSQITGTGVESGVDTDLDPIVLSQNLGFESQETVKVFRDTAYFLWKDGVYTVGSDGITCISDGSADKGNVRSWFVGDSYFNRGKFSIAFAHIDPYMKIYRLFLASAGSDVVDRWVEYSIDEKTWFGPHKTDMTSPVSAFTRSTADDITVPLIGTDASVLEEQEVRTDGTQTAIEFDAVGPRHSMKVPDDDKYFGELSMLAKPLSGGVLQVKSRTGDQNTTRVITQNFDMTLPRKRMGRLGKGKHSQIELVNAEVGKDVQVFGYEVDPVFILGRR